MMRGLEIRTDYATVKVLQRVLESELADAPLWSIVDEAWRLGHDDFHDYLDEAPLLFRSAPELLKAWKQGWATANAAQDSASAAH